MANSKEPKKKMNAQQRKARVYQIVFIVVTVIVLLSMLLTSFTN